MLTPDRLMTPEEERARLDELLARADAMLADRPSELPPWEPAYEDADSRPATPVGRLLEIGGELRLSRARTGEPQVTLPLGRRRATYGLYSPPVVAWFTSTYYTHFGEVPPRTVVEAALRVLHGQALARPGTPGRPPGVRSAPAR